MTVQVQERPHPLPDTRTLLQQARTSSPLDRPAIEEEIVRRYLRVSHSVASRYSGRGIDVEDLEQVARLGLVNAVRRFDPDRGSDFLSYALPTMRGEVRRHFRDCGWIVRPPRGLQEAQAQVFIAESELAQLLGASPLPGQIAAHLDIALELVVEALAIDGCFAPTSLDMRPREGGNTLADMLGADDVELHRVEVCAVLAGAVRQLTERDRHVIDLRFFRNWTQASIAAEIGVSQMQVSRMLHRILGDLRQRIDPDQS
jgi:RNA polymerase sigma-B factor